MRTRGGRNLRVSPATSFWLPPDSPRRTPAGLPPDSRRRRMEGGRDLWPPIVVQVSRLHSAGQPADAPARAAPGWMFTLSGAVQDPVGGLVRGCHGLATARP